MTPPLRVIRDENQRSGAPLVADPEPLPSDVSPHRLRRGLLRLGGVVAIAVAVVTLAPGLGELRSRVKWRPAPRRDRADHGSGAGPASTGCRPRSCSLWNAASAIS